MATPVPRKGESKNNFISRFIKATKDTYPSDRLAQAAALKVWDEAKRKK